MTATVKVTEISEKATEKDLLDFFSYSGPIAYIELKKSETKPLQIAYVTFQEEKALETAVLLTGAVIVDRAITVEPDPGYQPPASASAPAGGAAAAAGAAAGGAPSKSAQPGVSALPIPHKAQEVMADLLAKGYILGKDTLYKAKEFDDKHALTKVASTKARDLDQNAGISQTLSAGAATVNQQLSAVDEKFQVSAKTKAAFTVAESKLNEASQQLMKNKTVASATGWLSSAISSISQTATNVQNLASKKIEQAEGEKAGKVGKESLEGAAGKDGTSGGAGAVEGAIGATTTTTAPGAGTGSVPPTNGGVVYPSVEGASTNAPSTAAAAPLSAAAGAPGATGPSQP